MSLEIPFGYSEEYQNLIGKLIPIVIKAGFTPIYKNNWIYVTRGLMNGWYFWSEKIPRTYGRLIPEKDVVRVDYTYMGSINHYDEMKNIAELIIKELNINVRVISSAYMEDMLSLA